MSNIKSYRLTELFPTVYNLTRTDVGSGSDASVQAVLATRAESGTGADTKTLAIATARADSGSGIDTKALAALLAVIDSVTGLDISSLSTGITAKSGVDSGAGVEHFRRVIEGEISALLASFQRSDVGAGVDIVSALTQPYVLKTASDIGAGLEAKLLSILLSRNDSGTGLDLSTFIRFIIDSGIGIDLRTAMGFIRPEAGSGIDSVTSRAASLAKSDTGSGTESRILNALRLVSETVTSLESKLLTAYILATEHWYGVETSDRGLLKTAQDLGVGIDMMILRMYTLRRELAASRLLNAIRNKDAVRILP
jgi:hypothetical protein